MTWRAGARAGGKPQMMDGCELLSVLIAKILVLKAWLNLRPFQPEGSRPFRVRTPMATRLGSRISCLNASGEVRR